MSGREQYGTYQDYLTHQADKLERSGGEAFARPEKMVQRFLDRFRRIEDLPRGRRVLCVGARRGEEVRAWRRLGHWAIGVDLNPGLHNPDVIPGDFHALPFQTATQDVVYLNCLDHAWDWQQVVRECRRVVRDDGWFVLELQYGTAEGYAFGAHDCCVWETAGGMADQVAAELGWSVVQARNLGRSIGWLPLERLRQTLFGRALHPFLYQYVLRAPH